MARVCLLWGFFGGGGRGDFVTAVIDSLLDKLFVATAPVFANVGEFQFLFRTSFRCRRVSGLLLVDGK